MTGAGLLMAKRKASDPKKRPGPEPTGRRPVALTVKGSEEWRAWLDRAARHCRLSTSALVDLAVTQYARAQGFEEAPPER
jgi:hypothetical protein